MNMQQMFITVMNIQQGSKYSQKLNIQQGSQYSQKPMNTKFLSITEMNIHQGRINIHQNHEQYTVINHSNAYSTVQLLFIDIMNIKYVLCGDEYS